MWREVKKPSHGTARCVRPSVLERRPVYGQAEHRETLDKLYIDGEMSNNINELINYFCQS